MAAAHCSKQELALPVLAQLLACQQEHMGDDVPFVTLSYAQSIDGSISAADGRMVALSSDASMAMTHGIRSMHDAIMVGVGTITIDNPSLSVRGITGASQPVPVVLDTQLRIPLTSKVVQRGVQAHSSSTDPPLPPPVVLCSNTFLASDAGAARAAALTDMGARVVGVKTDEGSGRLNWVGVLAALHATGLGSVMVEGGAGVISSLLASTPALHTPLVHHVIITIAPLFIAGTRAPAHGAVSAPGLPAPLPAVSFPALGPARATKGAQSAQESGPDVHVVGRDVVLQGRLLSPHASATSAAATLDSSS